ncbi:hypothetical protein GCM10009720_10680 [Yaniella flava]|uniref:Uncharacterized protein n=1 Tax=Yaniella flava TaxID=287930 RepID=A0ABN2U9Z1_9MICC
MADKKAASVFPDPVGAITNACSPELIVSQAPNWALVGASKDRSNQERVASENAAGTESVMAPDYWW